MGKGKGKCRKEASEREDGRREGVSEREENNIRGQNVHPLTFHLPYIYTPPHPFSATIRLYSVF